MNGVGYAVAPIQLLISVLSILLAVLDFRIDQEMIGENAKYFC